MSLFQLEEIMPTHASHSSASCKLSKLLRNSSSHPMRLAYNAGLVELSLTRLTFVQLTVQLMVATLAKNVTVAASSVLRKILRFSGGIGSRSCDDDLSWSQAFGFFGRFGT